MARRYGTARLLPAAGLFALVLGLAAAAHGQTAKTKDVTKTLDRTRLPVPITTIDFVNLAGTYYPSQNENRIGKDSPCAILLHKYGSDYKLVFVGDATMSPYEILYPMASVEHSNPEPGAAWIRRLVETFPRAVWLNPEPERRWEHTQSLKLMQELLGQRMFPLTLDGLAQAMKKLG